MINIYLIGMMGAGKSVTGKCLAGILGYAFVDLDVEIEKKEGRTISEIFSGKGEDYFRDVETAVLKEFSARDRHVFATGGGVVLRDENVRCMKATGKVVLLETSLTVLWERICQKKDRPLLNTPDPKGALERILENRDARYMKASDLSVLTDGMNATAVARRIAEQLRGSKS